MDAYMKYCTITPNRGGERETLLSFCANQLIHMGAVNNSYIMNDSPKSTDCDLVPRIKQGIEFAKKDGFEWVFIIESDDSYPIDYFARYLPYMDRYDFIGDQNSLYYNIKTKRYRAFKHPRRASLFTTAFRVSALHRFKWPPDNTLFLDIKLWQYAKNFKCKFIDSGAVGIKGHGFGKHGGKGHTMLLAHEDPNLAFLKSAVSDVNFLFYTDLMKRL